LGGVLLVSGAWQRWQRDRSRRSWAGYRVAVCHRGQESPNHSHHPLDSGMLLFVLIALPWYVAVQIHNPEFFRVFILEHNFARFGSNTVPPQTTVLVLYSVVLLALLPWTVVIATGFGGNRASLVSERAALLDTGDALNVFSSFGFIVPMLFFSLSQSKLPGYILPALPQARCWTAELPAPAY